MDAGIENVNNTFALLADALAPQLTVGVDFAVAQDRLPVGWASVTLFDVRGEFTAVYSGPVLEETTETITLEVFEERMKPMVKKDCAIVRSLS